MSTLILCKFRCKLKWFHCSRWYLLEIIFFPTVDRVHLLRVTFHFHFYLLAIKYVDVQIKFLLATRLHQKWCSLSPVLHPPSLLTHLNPLTNCTEFLELHLRTRSICFRSTRFQASICLIIIRAQKVSILCIDQLAFLMLIVRTSCCYSWMLESGCHFCTLLQFLFIASLYSNT